MTTTKLRLKKREERRLQAGHLWVFSNEIDTATTPVRGLEPGQAIQIEDADGKFLAHAYANPQSLITARVTSRRRQQLFDAELIGQRLTHALALRERRYPEPFYRWVHGEGDALPGLVVDRYDMALRVQVTTAGMEALEPVWLEALSQVPGISSIELCNDTPVRSLEGLMLERRIACGEPPARLSVRENGLEWQVEADASQKTGWFYDHRDSRAALRHWARGARVLDLYSYLGGFALNALAAGAREALAVDSSASAMRAAQKAAEANGLGVGFQARSGDALVVMRELHEAGERFDVVVLDPPAFIKRKKDIKAGEQHYALNNRLAMQLLAPGGVLFSASCSQALDSAGLRRLIRRNTPRGSTAVQWLAPLDQAADHPELGAMPETAYLCGVVARLI